MNPGGGGGLALRAEARAVCVGEIGPGGGHVVSVECMADCIREAGGKKFCFWDLQAPPLGFEATLA